MLYNLQPGSLIKSNYIVQKVLFTSELASVYLVFDKKITGKNWVAKEFSFDATLTKEDIKERLLKLDETLESLKLYEHKYIAKIIDHFYFRQKYYVIMEYVEGVTFEEYIQSSAELIPEQQIIKWAIQICDVLHYFCNRPNPYIFGILDPTRIMREKDGNIRMINYGINRLFGAILPVIFSEDKIYFSKELNSLASFLIFIATKTKTTDAAVLENFSYSAEFKLLLAKCLDPKAHVVYGSFEEIRELFESLLKEEVKAPVPKPKLTIKTLKDKLLLKLNNFLFTFSIQKIQYQIAEIIGLLLLIGFIYYLANPVYKFTKQGPVVYILYGNKEIACIDPRSYKIIDKIILEESVNYIKTDKNGQRLYLSVCDKNINKIRMIECKNNTFNPKINITVDIDPRNILLDEAKEKLYVLNQRSNNISVVNLKTNKMSGIIPTGKKPTDIKELIFDPYIFVSNADSGTISVINKTNQKVIDTMKTGYMPYTMATSRKNKKIFVACQELNSLKYYSFYNDKNNEFEYTYSLIKDIGGKKTASMYLDKEERYIFAANAQTNNVSVVDLTNDKLKTSIYVGKKPVAMAFIEPNFLWIINQTSGTVTILNTYTNTIYKTFFVGKNPQCITYAP